MARPRARRMQPTYTDPALRERLKSRLLAGDRGGRPGQWSARKAQLLAAQYERMGGGFAGPRSEAQRHLEQWTQERWRTADGKRARRGKTMARYLPEKAWKELSPAQKRSTEKRKRAGSRKGRQFVGNTGPARQARRRASASRASPRAGSSRRRTLAPGRRGRSPARR